MAVPNSDPIVLGGANRASGARTLTIEQELDLTLAADTRGPFQQELMLSARCPMKMISGGKNYQWIVNGKLNAAYRGTLGAYEVGSDDYRNNEITIGVDREIISIEEVHDYDEFTSWWDVRKPIVQEVGRVLGRANEVKCTRALFVSADKDMPAGTDYTNIIGGSDMRTAAARLETITGCGAATRAGLQTTDGSGVVEAIRNIAVKIYEMGDNPALYTFHLAPADYSWFAGTEAAKEVIDRDFSSNGGDYAEGKLPRIKEIAIEQAPGVTAAAFTNVTAGWLDATYERNDYVNDNSATLGVIARMDKAVGGVGLFDLQTRLFEDPRTDTWVFRGKTCVGYGALESQCAFSVDCAV